MIARQLVLATLLSVAPQRAPTLPISPQRGRLPWALPGVPTPRTVVGGPTAAHGLRNSDARAPQPSAEPGGSAAFVVHRTCAALQYQERHAPNF